MSTESISDRREHIRSVSVTALAALLGVGAAFASAVVTGEPGTAGDPEDTQALLVVGGAILVQLVLYNATSIYDDDEFGAKHHLYIVFMTFALWFLSWGILLSAEASA